MQVLEEFYNIFGPELKSVTGDPQRIEDVLKRVDGLVEPIQEVSSFVFFVHFTQIPVAGRNKHYQIIGHHKRR